MVIKNLLFRQIRNKHHNLLMKLFGTVALIFLLQNNLTGQILNQLKVNPGTQPGRDRDVQTAGFNSDSIKNLYFKTVASPYEIINGKEYIFYSYPGKSTPLLFSGSVFRSDLIFNNRKYSNVKLQYDTFIDEVIYTDTSRFMDYGFPRMCLNKELIDKFNINYNGEILNFTYMRFPDDSKNHPEDGFYELAYDGPSRYIIKHRSTLYIRDAINEYSYSPVSYILIGGTYGKFKNTKDFILMFGQRAEEIKEFIQRKKIKIRKADKKDICEILKYYDSPVR